MRETVKGQADVVAFERGVEKGCDVTARSRRWRGAATVCFGKYVWGVWLKPVLGRLLSDADDVTQGAHPYAVISYDYWVKRFGRDPQVIGRTFPHGR